MRKKILDTAQNVFNQKGIQHSTLRDIAKELSISDGHLRYYFKTKEELILAIFIQMDEAIAAFTPTSDTAAITDRELLLEPLTKSYQVMYEYAFFFKESTAILEMYPKVYKAYQILIEKRKSILLEVFNEYKAKGIFAHEADSSLFPILFEQFFIISDNWIKYAKMKTDNDLEEKEQITHFVAISIALFLPYLQRDLKEDILKWIKEPYSY